MCFHHTNKLQKNHNENQYNSSLMGGWKITLTWCYNGSCKLVTLELHNSCSCTFTTELHELHRYIIPHMVSCVHYNSCNSFDNIHTMEIC